MTRAVFALLVTTLASALAHAGTVDVVASDPAVAAEVQQWFAARGSPAPRTRLDAQRTATLRDCIVIDEPACAAAVVDNHAEADVVVLITVDSPRFTVHWFPKRGKPAMGEDRCEGCTTPQLHQRVLQQVAALAPVSTAAAPAATIAASGKPTPNHRPRGLALGVELGEPSSATAAWFAGPLAVIGGLGTGTFDGPGLALRAQVQLEVTRLAPAIALRAGLGARRYHHGYRAASIDELPDTHTGIFASVTASLDRGPLQLYAELAPGLDVIRTRSCALASGSATICPHAQEAPVFVHFLVGARWFLSR